MLLVVPVVLPLEVWVVAEVVLLVVLVSLVDVPWM